MMLGGPEPWLALVLLLGLAVAYRLDPRSIRWFLVLSVALVIVIAIGSLFIS